MRLPIAMTKSLIRVSSAASISLFRSFRFYLARVLLCDLEQFVYLFRLDDLCNQQLLMILPKLFVILPDSFVVGNEHFQNLLNPIQARILVPVSLSHGSGSQIFSKVRKRRV